MDMKPMMPSEAIQMRAGQMMSDQGVKPNEPRKIAELMMPYTVLAILEYLDAEVVDLMDE